MTKQRLAWVLGTLIVFFGALAVIKTTDKKHQIVKHIKTDSIYIDSLDKFIKLSTYHTQDSVFIDEVDKFQIGDTVVWH